MQLKKTLVLVLVFCLLITTVFSLVACSKDKPDGDNKPVLTLKKTENSVEIDAFDTTYTELILPSLFNESLTDLMYEVSTESNHITFSRVTAEGKVNIISDGVIGVYTVNVKVKQNQKCVLDFAVTVNVIDGSPDPTVKAQIPNATLAAPVFPKSEATYLEYKMDLSNYFEAENNVTYELECADTSVILTSDEVKPYLVTLAFKSVGEKSLTIYAVKQGERIVNSTFTLNLVKNTPEQLINGGFENGLSGWNLDAWAKAAYAVSDSEVDIWGNRIDSEGSHLNGFFDETGTCEFTSSVFTVGGTGMITWKMSGNCGSNLQFVLMQYNAEGEDVEIAKFNNWYYGVYAASGFIFRDYYYQMDASYIGSKCYFKVVDNDIGNDGFGFLNLDSIVTYHATKPDVTDMYKANYMVDPDGLTLDYTDTSAAAFPADLSSVGNQLKNGNFESGFDGWYMTTAEKRAYSIYGSKTDIWGNSVNASGNYLYGYAQENFASANFHSSLFRVDGTGLISFKMAGNSTSDLQFVLMKYNAGGDDVEVAKFNNWYFRDSNESGFILRQYYYQIDMDTYDGSYFYFVVKDYRNGDFGFICLDDIVTYYETAPAIGDSWYKAGYCSDPDANK